MTEKVQIGDATLYLGDCLEILPTLGKVDAVVTDLAAGAAGEHLVCADLLLLKESKPPMLRAGCFHDVLN